MSTRTREPLRLGEEAEVETALPGPAWSSEPHPPGGCPGPAAGRPAPDPSWTWMSSSCLSRSDFRKSVHYLQENKYEH